MEKMNKKPNVLLALLLSLLTALAGGLIFGLIYASGYYVYLLALAEIILSCTVFLKQFSNINKKTIAGAIFWTVIWTFVFNISAIVVCEAYWIAQEFNIKFTQAINVLTETWLIDAEIQNYMNTRALQVAGMILLGGIVYGIYYLVNQKKNKKVESPTPSMQSSANQSATNLNQQENTSVNSKDYEITLKYELIVAECKDSLIKYAQDMNPDSFRSEILEIKQRLITPLSEDQKQKLNKHCLNQQNVENLSTLDKKAIETILKMLDQQ